MRGLEEVLGSADPIYAYDVSRDAPDKTDRNARCRPFGTGPLKGITDPALKRESLFAGSSQ